MRQLTDFAKRVDIYLELINKPIISTPFSNLCGGVPAVFPVDGDEQEVF